MNRKRLREVGAAINLVTDFLRDVDDSGRIVIHGDGSLQGQPVDDPLDCRNMAIREMVIAYLEFQFRRQHQQKQQLPSIVTSLDSTRIVQLLETAAEAHQKFTAFD